MLIIGRMASRKTRLCDEANSLCGRRGMKYELVFFYVTVSAIVIAQWLPIKKEVSYRCMYMHLLVCFFRYDGWRCMFDLSSPQRATKQTASIYVLLGSRFRGLFISFSTCICSYSPWKWPKSILLQEVSPLVAVVASSFPVTSRTMRMGSIAVSQGKVRVVSGERTLEKSKHFFKLQFLSAAPSVRVARKASEILCSLSRFAVRSGGGYIRPPVGGWTRLLRK